MINSGFQDVWVVDVVSPGARLVLTMLKKFLSYVQQISLKE
jgi:hypothetical protein